MTAPYATFQQALDAAIDDIVANGFDSVERVDRWLRALRGAAERSLATAASVEERMRQALVAIYQRMVDRDGIFRYQQGAARFTKERVRPRLRAELDRRIMASANLIRLNRANAIDQTLQRFSGWSTSIPRGGSSTESKAEVRRLVRKSMRSLPFEERRVRIDQGHKLVAGLSEILATDGGAIAARWRSHWRQPGYDYRPDHKERDQQIYLVRDSWAHKAGLVKPGRPGYLDAITQPAQEPYCRCFAVWIYHLRDLPADMVTERGRGALAGAVATEALRSQARADAAVSTFKISQEAAGYVGSLATRPLGERCGACSMFVAPRECTDVEGPVDTFGWCRIFASAQAAA